MEGDVVIGGPGKDTATLGCDRLYGRSGRDFAWGDIVRTTEAIGGGDDLLSGMAGDDEVNGQWGEDDHKCGAGSDEADGGPDLDTHSDCEEHINM